MDAAPLDTLFDRTADDGAARGDGMPADLERRYGSPLLVPLRTDRATVVANFVSTLDGVVAMGGGDLTGGGLISGFHEPDRFVMALLRAVADIVVVGAGTLRGSTSHRWIADHVQPALAPSFAEWRSRMGLASRPTTVVVSGSGEIPVDHPGLIDSGIPVVIVTTPRGAARLRHAGPGPDISIVSTATDAAIAGNDILRLAGARPGSLVLSEGGPRLLGRLVADDLLDELFLTVAPQLVGRDGAERIGLVEGVALPPPDARWHELRSVRRSDDHLFLRYRRRAGGPNPRETRDA